MRSSVIILGKQGLDRGSPYRRKLGTYVLCKHPPRLHLVLATLSTKIGIAGYQYLPVRASLPRPAPPLPALEHVSKRQRPKDLGRIWFGRLIGH